MYSKSKIKPFLLALTYCFFSMGLNGSDLGLPTYITFSRIAYFILILTLIIHIFDKKKTKKTSIKQQYKLLFLLFLLVIWTAISHLVSPFGYSLNMNRLIYWLLLIVTVLSTTILVNDVNREWLEVFTKTILIINLFLSFVTVFWFISEVSLSNLNNIFIIRNKLNQVSVGLNRFFNGLFFVSFLSIPIVLGLIQEKKMYLVSLFNFIILLTLVVFSGSRQNLIAIIVYIILLKFTSKNKDNDKNDLKRKRKQFIFTFLIIISVFLVILSTGTNLFTFIEKRFISTVANKNIELGVADPRINILQNSLPAIMNRPLFGHGTGTFTILNNQASHNGYLNLVFEIGIVPFIFFGIFIINFFVQSFKKIAKLNGFWFSDFYKVTVYFIFVIIFISNIFNDLIYINNLWMLIVIINKLSSTKFNNKKKILESRN